MLSAFRYVQWSFPPPLFLIYYIQLKGSATPRHLALFLNYRGSGTGVVSASTGACPKVARLLERLNRTSTGAFPTVGREYLFGQREYYWSVLLERVPR